MGNDAIGYFFIILLLLIAAPLLFWIGSMLYAWVKWLFNDKQKLNASYSEVNDIHNPIANSYEVKYRLGTESTIQLSLVDTKYNEFKNLLEEQQKIGKHSFILDTKEIANGVYFLVLKTANQKITKKIVIEN